MRKAIPLIALLTLVWGTAWQLFPIAVREISVWTFRAVSLIVAGMLLMAVAWLRGESLRIPRAHWGTMITTSWVYLVVWNVTSTYATLLIPTGQAAILGYTMPLWTALIAWAAMGQRPSPRLLLALAFGGLGVGLLIYQGVGMYSQAPLGFALGLASGLGWALGTILLKRRPVPVSSLVLTAWQVLVAGVPVMLIAMVRGDGHWFMPSTTTIAVIAYIILLPMAIGNVAWFAIVGLLPANIAGLSSIMVPVIAMVSGAIVLREPLGPVQWVALLCCAAGFALAVLKPAAPAAK